jgi:endonuclease I
VYVRHHLKSLFLVLALLAQLKIHAVEPPGYYRTVDGMKGLSLRQGLHLILTNAVVIPYSSIHLDTSDALKVVDEDPADTNNVILLYTRRSEPKSTFGTTAGWNREHVWPNSYGLDSHEPAYSDLHNLRAADATVNSARGNKFYDISATNTPGYKRPGSPEAPLTSTDIDSWEPPDVVKGDIARALFYMATRYTGDRTNEPALFITDTTIQIGSATNLMGRLATLLRWHLADPVDAGERLRNDRVFERYQHNRNPFVDRPEWVMLAFGAQLGIELEALSLRVNWRGEFSDSVLESAPLMSATWTPVTNVATLRTNGFSVLLPNHSQPQFFRLRLN